MSSYAYSGQQRINDLNRAVIPNADGDDIQLAHRPEFVVSGRTEIIFHNHAFRLQEEIRKADFVLGAVAWLTHDAIITALSEVKYGCSMIVQKEDFLRPDLRVNVDRWPTQLRARYNRLRCDIDRYHLPSVAGRLSIGGDPTVSPIRCVGNHNSEKTPASPRMHNKFLVLCSVAAERHAEGHFQITPHTVWTGSFNFTTNATSSLENAVVMRDPVLAEAYGNEWAHIFALSEPLDWDCSWVAPEY